jgi:VWFA-related protein
VEIIAFSRQADRRLPLGTDRAAARAAIAEIAPGGQTGLFEAVLIGIRDLERLERDRRPGQYRTALVVLSDGGDTSSRVSFDQVLEDARRSGVLVYGVSLRTDERGRSLAPPFGLAQLAHDTGGWVIAAHEPASVISIYQDIGAELRHLYRLGYNSSNPARDGAWRPLSVRVANPEARVRARAGYYAPRGLPRFAREGKR